MFSIIQPLFLQKTKLFIWDWDLNLVRKKFNFRVSVVRGVNESKKNGGDQSPHGSKRSDGPYKILKGCGNGGSTHNVFGLWIAKSEIQCCFRFLSSIFKTMKIACASQSASFCISGARKTCEMTSNNACFF